MDQNFLDNRKQSVVTNGFHSGNIPVSSGVLQGTVFGPILFLAYNLPEHVRSRVRIVKRWRIVWTYISRHRDFFGN